jgi:hypothetical protein
MLPLKEPLQIAGIMLHYREPVWMQVEFTRRQFTFKFYFTFPLTFVLGKLKSRGSTLSGSVKG